MRRTITLQEKLKALKEVENIYRLSKKTLPPRGKTWAQIADRVLEQALGRRVQSESTEVFDMRPGKMHHEHSPRTARVVERTLRNGMHHPDVLHHYRGDHAPLDQTRAVPQRHKIGFTDDTPDVIHYVQHGASDLVYPGGHMQGQGFVPRSHEVASHVQLEQSVRSASNVVPTSQQGPAYH